MKTWRYLAVFLFCIFCLPTAAFGEQIQLSLDNEPMVLDQRFGGVVALEPGIIQIPFRQVMERLGCEITWDQESQSAIAKKDGVIVSVPVGEDYIFSNQQKIQSAAVSTLRGGQLYVSIREVLEALGNKVIWNGEKGTVEIVQKDTTVSKGKPMSIHFLDVGQSDCIFIDYGDYEILIDGGDYPSGKKVVDYIKPYVDGAIELIIGTHEHADHIGGIVDVINAFDVNRILDNGRSLDTKSYQGYHKAANGKLDCKYETATDTILDLGGGASLQVMPLHGPYGSPNENCIITMLSYGNVKVLFMSDLEAAVEKANLNRFTDVDVLKVGHHGSRTASSQEFLNVTKPEVSVISVGRENTFALPNPYVLQRLLNMKSLVYGTYRSSDIVMQTDGSIYSFNTDRSLTPQDGSDWISQFSNASLYDAAYFGNERTKKLHTTSCVFGEKVGDHNIVYFLTREDAVAGGFTPCHTCKP